MKYGYRKPSLKKSISARTTAQVNRSINKSINPMYGKKGMGYINNPEKAVYNKTYRNTTRSILDKEMKANILVGIVVIAVFAPIIWVAFKFISLIS